MLCTSGSVNENTGRCASDRNLNHYPTHRNKALVDIIQRRGGTFFLNRVKGRAGSSWQFFRDHYVKDG